jgi:hypothetical protein
MGPQVEYYSDMLTYHGISQRWRCSQVFLNALSERHARWYRLRAADVTDEYRKLPLWYITDKA